MATQVFHLTRHLLAWNLFKLFFLLRQGSPKLAWAHRVNYTDPELDQSSCFCPQVLRLQKLLNVSFNDPLRAPQAGAL